MVKNDFDFLSWGMLVKREHVSNVAQIGSGVFSMKIYKVCSVLDVRLLFLSDWSFKASASAICGGHRYQRRFVCRQEEFYVFWSS